MSNIEFPDTMCYKCIYVMRIDDERHWGLVKIGEATVHSTLGVEELTPDSKPLREAAHHRIKGYTNTAGFSYTLLYTELAVRKELDDDGTVVYKRFKDNDVREVLVNSGIENVKLDGTTGREWYRAGLPTAKKAIAAVKDGELSIPGMAVEYQTPPFEFRPEQTAAAEFTVRRFEKTDSVLWNAKMRFGKTLTALDVVRRMELERVAILTHRPVVEDGWHKDFNKLFFGDTEYRFGSRKTTTLDHLLGRDKPFVYFASIEDARGSDVDGVNGKYAKNELLFKTLWDLVIIDEAHEGTTTDLGKATIGAIVKEGEGHTKTLRLSGTPFNIISDFPASDIFTWDYVMEQRRKWQWNETHLGETNPYEDLPELAIYTYDLGKVFAGSAYAGGDEVAFNFREFFRTWEGDLKKDRKPLSEGTSVGDFVHEGDVRSFLNLLVDEDSDAMYPFSTERYRDMFRHTFWVVPGVDEARALQSLMKEHPVFGSGAFEMVNVTGDEELDADKALTNVQNAIKRSNSVGGYTVTLSCGRLTTGVTIPEWSAVMMLSGSYSTSAANYMQTIFRVQSPGEIDGKVKERAYVFDFAPDRTLKMVAEAVKVSAKSGGTNEDERKRLGEFLNFCPVIGLAGSRMAKYEVPELLQSLKKAYADRVVQSGFEDESLYTDSLFRLDEDDATAFNELSSIISKSTNERTGTDIIINDQGLTEEEFEQAEKASRKKREERTDEEQALAEAWKKAREERKKAIKTLRQISVRMPLLIFGADIPLSVDLTIDGFIDLVDEASWRQFMPKGVSKEIFSKFRRFYDEDVFIAAGRRIRDVARHADTLDPTERVKCIAQLFSYFKNPDKETVLTPWRVVNMQLADCLGGWDFFDDPHRVKDEREEPRFVDRGTVTARTIGNMKTRILEMNSKTGLYPLYVAYSIYRTRLGDSGDGLSIDEKYDLWFDTVRDNVFVLCMTKMAEAITRRVLVGYSGRTARFVCQKDLVGTLKTDRLRFCEQIRIPEFWGMEGDKVHFSAVVGNPAYQMKDGGYSTSASPIYHEFVQAAKSLDPDYISMITPSRWFAGGKGLSAYRDAMLHDQHLSRIVDFPRLYEPFPNVKIRGGISYFLWDKEHNGPCSVQTMMLGKPVGEAVKRDIGEFDVLVRRNEAVSILRKVKAKNEPTLDERVSARKPFGLPTNYRDGKRTKAGLRNPIKLYVN